MKENPCDPSVDGSPPAVLPSLRRAAVRGAIVIFGGEVRRPKLAELRRRAGLPIEWVAMRDAERLAWRVRRGDVAAVVLLDGLVSHAATDSLVKALRRCAVPHAHGGRGGLRRVLDALVALDGRLAAATGGS